LKISLPTASSRGRRQRGSFYFFRKLCGVFIFLENYVPRAPDMAVGKDGFLFFEKNHVPRARDKGRRQRRFFILFKKNSLPSASCNYARQS
jgi:hypothetical protein